MERQVVIEIAPDGTMKIRAEGKAGFEARELTAELRKMGPVLEEHKGLHPQGHSHGAGGHVHTH